MSRSTFQRKAGLIFALAAFVLGVTAATALGWANEKNNKGKDHGKNETPPTVTTPTPTPAPPEQPQQVPTTPAPTPAPPAAAPAPVTPQSTPAQTPPQRVKEQGEQKGEKQQQEQNVPAEVTPATQTALAPVVERKQLARTGLDPVLMALLGAFCLAGGGLLFRRAVTRQG
jgi:hypothetical protein